MPPGLSPVTPLSDERSGSTAPDTTRYFALDALRATAMLLGVLYHALLFGGGMMGGPGGESSPGTILMDWIHTFRMPLFFLISGFFSHMMLLKYGGGSYLAKRWWKIGVPFLLVLFALAGIRAAFPNAGFNGPGGPPGGGPPDGAMPGPPGFPSPPGASGPMAMGPGPMPGGPGGGRPGFGPDGPPGFGGGGGFGPGMMLASPTMETGDANHDGALSKEEFKAVAGVWFKRVNPENRAALSQEQFLEHADVLFPAPPGFGPPDGEMGGAGMPGPAQFMGPGLYRAMTAGSADGLTLARMEATFDDWMVRWDGDKNGSLTTAEVQAGWNEALRDGGGGPPGFPGGGMPGPPGAGMPGPPGGPGGGMPFGAGHPLSDRLFGGLSAHLSLQHLWFLWYLLVFVTAAPVVSWAVGKIVPSRVADRLDRIGVHALQTGWAFALLAVASLPGLLVSSASPGHPPGGYQTIFGTFPDVLFQYDRDWPYFFTYFLFGWGLYRLRSSLPLIGRTAIPVLVASIGLQVAATKFATPGGSFPMFGQQPPLTLTAVGQCCVFAFAAAATIWGLLGVFQRFLDRPSALGRYLAETAFWVYLVHQDLLNMVVLGWLRPLGLPMIPQALLAVLVTSGLALISFELLIRPTPLRVLFGSSSQVKPRTPETPASPLTP